jgi:predicted  nucleic acid-binding Zn-ribbon protein
VITSLPEPVQQAWGTTIAREFTVWLEGIMTDGVVERDEFRQLDTRMIGMERRLTGVEDRLTGVETRLTGVETRLTNVEHDVADLKVDLREFRREVNERFDRVNERFDLLYERMNVQMRWTVGVLALFGTLITLIVAVAQLTP